MIFWLAIGAAAAVSAVWLARPFWRRSSVEPNECDHAMSIYRDQRDELRRDMRHGLISEAERDAAEQEIELRALRAAKQLDSRILVSRPNLTAAVIAMTLIIGGSMGLYGLLGAPTEQDQPLTARRTAILERQAQAGDLESRAMLLVERTKENPDSFEDWWLLARAYAALGDYALASDAYRKAVALSDEDPAVLSAYAEALTLANGNKVPTAAKLIFTQAQQRSNDPRARYYLALAKAQAQDFEGALGDWLQLRNDSAPDAPWMPMVRRDIVNMVRFLDLDLQTVLPDATAAELAKAAIPVDGGPASVSTIADLEADLERNPKDWEGWIALARLHAGRGDETAARAAIEEGRGYYGGAPFVLAKLDEAARDLGLVERREIAGPSAADVAAASGMSEQDRDAMVRGMVDGLASRLAMQPQDLEGWLMLIRSYAVLQEPVAAREAVQEAKSVFAAAPGDVLRISRLADSLGIVVE